MHADVQVHLSVCMRVHVQLQDALYVPTTIDSQRTYGQSWKARLGAPGLLGRGRHREGTGRHWRQGTLAVSTLFLRDRVGIDAT